MAHTTISVPPKPELFLARGLQLPSQSNLLFGLATHPILKRLGINEYVSKFSKFSPVPTSNTFPVLGIEWEEKEKSF
jgi:hypothetical protein